MKLQGNGNDLHADLSILDLINNVNKKYTLGRQEYLMLLKKQKQKDYCTLYIADCESRVWIKKVDQVFLQNARESMSINSDLKVFVSHFGKNLKENSRLSIEGDSAKLQIELKIGEGLLMTYDFNIESCIGLEESPNDYKVVLKMFIRQLYEAKESQIEQQRNKWQKEQKQKKQSNPDKADRLYVSQVLNGLKKEASDIKPKNRSLMNPNQKRRKEGKIKFQGTI